MCDGDNGPASYRFVEVSGVVLNGPGILYAINVTVQPAGGHCELYDGVNASGQEIFSSQDQGAIGVPTSFVFGPGIPFQQGLYIAITSTHVTLVYRPLPG